MPTSPVAEGFEQLMFADFQMSVFWKQGMRPLDKLKHLKPLVYLNGFGAHYSSALK